jgi:hypothetical protein
MSVCFSYNVEGVVLMASSNQMDFLRQSPDPWVRLRTLIDIDGLPTDEPQVRAAKAAVLDHPLVAALLAELKGWPGVVLNSHKSAGQLYHKLSFLAEIGLTTEDGGLAAILDLASAHLSQEGLPQMPANVAVHYGGTGQDTWGWALCDAPLMLWLLLKMGSSRQTDLLRGAAYLQGLVRGNGWPCVVSPELGRFRGPGRKDDPCPYATLLMLKLLQLPVLAAATSPAAAAAVECLLTLWQDSLNQHPYMFFMGTDFRKLKAPFIWYDLLHVTDVLSQSPLAVRDPRFLSMVDLINSKAGSDGLFTPESEWKAWGCWDFGQKKQPSVWLTFLVCRINHRVNYVS